MDLSLLAYLKEQYETEKVEIDHTKCHNCGGSDFIEIDYERICEEYQAIDPRYAVFTTENHQGYSGRTIAVWTTLKRAFSAIKVYRSVRYRIAFMML